MEVQAIYKIVVEGWNSNVYFIGTIVSDDDTTMKAQLKHSFKKLIEANQMRKEDWPRTKGNTKKADTGRLPLEITPPNFLADPNHRKKVVGKHLYALAKLAKKASKVDKALALRLKDYWGAYLKQVRDRNFETDGDEIMRLSKAPLEHCFNNHEFCSKTWCYKLQADEKGIEYYPPENRPFYDMIIDAGMYQQLKECFEPFATEKSIRESLHPFETNLNEALMNAIQRTCPKFKLLGTSMTLTTRVCKVLCTRNMGFKNYITTVLKNLNVNQLECKQYYFDKAIVRIDRNKIRNYRNQQSRDYLRKRKHKKEASKREQVLSARTEKKVGTYGSGAAFENNDSENEDKKNKKNTKEKFCNWCDKITNHTTYRSKHCVSHDEYLLWKNEKDKMVSYKFVAACSVAYLSFLLNINHFHLSKTQENPHRRQKTNPKVPNQIHKSSRHRCLLSSRHRCLPLLSLF